MKEFKNGLLTGLALQLAIGPVFFFIINLTIKNGILDGFAGVIAVTLIDFMYISLSILGIGELLKKKRIKKLFGIIGPIVLIIFGFVILKGIFEERSDTIVNSTDIIASFTSVALITLSNPLTIIFFTGLFSAKALEYNYTKRQLYLFGMGTGLMTLIFMGSAVILFSMIRDNIPEIIIQGLNGMVGIILIGYGIKRLSKEMRTDNY